MKKVVCQRKKVRINFVNQNVRIIFVRKYTFIFIKQRNYEQDRLD